MKNKNYKLVVVAGFLGSCSLGLVSCDGGSSDSTPDLLPNVAEAELLIPDVPNAANSELIGDSKDESGANVALEAEYEVDVFDGINAAREANGLSVLVLNSELSALAEVHNQGLVSRANVGGAIQIDHIGAQGRANTAFASGFVTYGENVAGIRGFSESESADALVQGWIDSPGHFENITGDYTDTGIAVTVDERDGTIYATQVFAQ